MALMPATSEASCASIPPSGADQPLRLPITVRSAPTRKNPAREEMPISNRSRDASFEIADVSLVEGTIALRNYWFFFTSPRNRTQEADGSIPFISTNVRQSFSTRGSAVTKFWVSLPLVEAPPGHPREP